MNEQMILSDQYDSIGVNFEEIKEFLATKKDGKIIGKEHDRYLMGVNSPLLNVAVVKLYDNPLLLEKYPDGIVTETVVLIPVEKFLEIKEQATNKSRNKFKSPSYIPEIFTAFVNAYMTRFIEVSLNLELSEDENKKLKEHMLTKYTTLPDMNIDSSVKTTDRELLKVISGQNFYLEEILKNTAPFEKEVKEIIKENSQYVTEIDSILNKIKEVKIEDINTNITNEEFDVLITKAEMYEISPLITLKVINKMSDQLFTECDRDAVQFSEKGGEKLFPLMSKLMPLQYKLAVEHILNNVIEVEGNDNAQNRQKIAIKITQFADNFQRDIVITGLTGYDKMAGIRLSSNANKNKMN